MPKVSWGVRAKDVDNFDRDSQFTPYRGPIPANGVYQWKIKKLQHVAATGEKNPQLRIGLELVPRGKDERRYKDYFVMLFPPISERTAFRYVPFLDAIGVSGKEFEVGTMTDQEGNIKKIGRWRNDGETLILGELKDDTDQNGNVRKTIGWMGPLDEEDSDEDDDFDDEAEDDEDEDDEDSDWDDD